MKFWLATIFFVSLASLLAPWIAPYDFDFQNLDLAYQSPSFVHWFGNDALGRDLLSRILYGGQVSIAIALITALTSIVIGVLVGSLAGWWGGSMETIIMRGIDVLNTLPQLVIMILVMMIFGRGLPGIFAALTITGWLSTARIMRNLVKSYKSRPFVEASRSLGASPFRQLFRHILPNCMAPLIVELSYQIPSNVLAEAFLSFLGIGLAPPTPSWGVLAEEGWRSLQTHPHLVFFPGLVIFITMLAFNLVGDALRDRLDPFLRGR